MIDNNSIGINIRTARNELGLTQRQVSEMTEISQTQLSDYENGKKTPGLYTLAKLSRVLQKSMDELFYGDANVSFITSAPHRGRVIANCVYCLWENDVISQHYSSEDAASYGVGFDGFPVIDLHRHSSAVDWLLEMLDDFQQRKRTYKDPDTYLEQLLDSAAEEIGE